MQSNSSKSGLRQHWYSLGLKREIQILIWISIITVFVLSLLDLAGWIFNITLFKSIIPQWMSMKIIAAVCFILAATSLLMIHSNLPVILRKILPRILSVLLCIVSLMTIYLYLCSFIKGHEPSFARIYYLRIIFSPGSRMSLSTAGSFFLLGCILLFLSVDNKKAYNIAHALIIPLILVSYYVLISYILGVYSSKEMFEVSLALNTTIAFFGICVAVLMIRPDTWLLKVFLSADTGGIFARKLLPGLMILPLIIGWFRIRGERMELFKSEEGVVLVAITYTVCFLILVLLTARSVNKMDQKRRITEEALRKSEQKLKYHIENSPLAVIEWDKNYLVTQWSEAAEKIFGWKKEETIGKTIDKLNIIYEDDIAEVEKTMGRLSGGRELNVISSNRNYTRSKEIRECIWYNSVLPDEEGQMSSVMSVVEDVTEIRKFEKLLKESQEMLLSVLNATQESIYMFNRDGIITMSNSTGLERLNKNSANEVVGHHFSEFMPESTSRFRQAKLDHVFSSGKPLEFEDEREGKTYIHNFFPVFKDDNVSHVVAYSTDITERKRAESNLKESEDRFRTIAESLPVMISIYSIKESKFSFFNESYEKVFGFQKGELEDKNLLNSSLNPEDRISLGNTLREKGRVYNKEIRVRKADGTPFWIMTSIRKILFMDDPAYLSASIDITATKKAQEELLQLNRTLNAHSKSSQAMMHSNSEFNYLNEVCKIIIEDCGHSMVWVGYAQNDEHKSVKPVAYYGFDEKYIENLNITWADNEMGRGPTGTAIRTGKPSICRNMLTDPAFKPWRKAAIERGYASSLVLPLISEGKPFGSISIYSKDQDPFSENEINMLSDLADDLAYGISYIRLEESEKSAVKVIKENEVKLKELIATKDKFFNIVAHDLKNPFTSLLGSSELLYDNINQLDTNNIRDLAMILNDSAKSGYAILQNLLDWSRSQTGLLKINPERVNLRILIDENLSILKLPAANKEIKIFNEIKEDVFIIADKNMINTVLRNLLNNALKFTYKSGKVILSTRITADEVVVSVKDTGTGIPEDKIDKLFSIDSHNSLPGTENEQGTGLGLKLTKEFVEKLGGRIWVESIAGQGSEFKFAIPLNNKMVQRYNGTMV